MHEHVLIKDLLKKVNEISAKEGKKKVISLKVKLGALSHISAEHFREHFNHETKGTSLEGAKLYVEELSDISHPKAQEIILESLELKI